MAQRVLAHTLDTLLRLLHPMIPFLTEDVWQRLGEIAPERGIDEILPAAESIMVAPWPECDPMRQDAEIEAQFARFQEVLRAVRDIRARQGVAPKTPLRVFRPLRRRGGRSASSDGAVFRVDGQRPGRRFRPGRDGPGPKRQRHAFGHGRVRRSGRLDRRAGRDRAEEAGGRKAHRLHRREGEEAHEQEFRRSRPAEVVQKERDSLKDLQDQLAAAREVLERLEKK